MICFLDEIRRDIEVSTTSYCIAGCTKNLPRHPISTSQSVCQPRVLRRSTSTSPIQNLPYSIAPWDSVKESSHRATSTPIFSNKKSQLCTTSTVKLIDYINNVKTSHDRIVLLLQSISNHPPVIFKLIPFHTSSLTHLQHEKLRSRGIEFPAF